MKRLFTDILGSLNTATLKRLLIRAWIHLDVLVWSFMCIAVSFWEWWVTVWCAIVNSAVPKPELLEKPLSGIFIYTQYLFQMVGNLIMLTPCFSQKTRQRHMYPRMHCNKLVKKSKKTDVIFIFNIINNAYCIQYWIIPPKN